MKKQLIVLFCAMLSIGAIAQTNEHALGLRLGGGNYFGAEVSYQRGLSNTNRLEADLGLSSYSNGSGFNLAGIYHWVWNIEGGFNWYAGPGAQIGSWSYKSGKDGDRSSGVYLGLGGQVGVEYNFEEIPLNLSVDTRPMFGIGNTYNDFNFGISFGLRYVF
ncbi:hypothetical protein [Carboxylicivirga sp. N1Y90]|uniref:hypothetical protein n=1 Tax=Carboxylicivirga fragile TaxID=3417571 RepID=UPI003D334911|nr:hypothetical protein [Marinilabiliaceae bacterium N1Y90]